MIFMRFAIAICNFFLVLCSQSAIFYHYVLLV